MKLITATAVVLASALLVGCSASVPPRVEYKEVRVLVPVPCLKEKPEKPKELITDEELKKLDSYHAMIALWLDRHLRYLYEKTLEAALESCWMPQKEGM